MSAKDIQPWKKNVSHCTQGKDKAGMSLPPQEKDLEKVKSGSSTGMLSKRNEWHSSRFIQLSEKLPTWTVDKKKNLGNTPPRRENRLATYFFLLLFTVLSLHICTSMTNVNKNSYCATDFSIFPECVYSNRYSKRYPTKP